jgi:phosphopantetheinyl transferase
MIEVQPLDAFWRSLGEHASPSCHVLLVDISAPGAPGHGPAALRDLLCSAERERLHRFRVAEAAWEYEASHVALRMALGRVLATPASEIRFRNPADPASPPEPIGAALRECRASLSHCRRFAAVAICHEQAVGVDVELLSQAGEALGVVRQFLSEAEMAELSATPSEDRPELALSAWCLKEAVLKSAGTGFQTDPRTVRLNIDPALRIGDEHAQVSIGDTHFWSAILKHPAAPDACIALSLEHRRLPVLICCATFHELVGIAAGS